MKTTTIADSLGARPVERCRWYTLLSSRPTLLVIVAGIFSALFRVTYTRHSISRAHERVANPLEFYDPADEWQDNTWPLRNQTPWDISSDYPFPRLLEYDVEEGTWMRLDVHPTSGDIVFDLIGDLYCLPGEAYLPGPRATPSRARPILLGVPHDTEPRFSPDGKWLAFRSDAELGVDNAWLMNWEGCDEMDVRPSSASGPLLDVLASSRFEEDLLATGVKETSHRKQRRLLREGRMGARRITNETFRRVTDPRFHPSGKKIISTKWFTSRGTGGAGEGWQFDIPSGPEERVEAGAGKRLISRTLPLGWSPSRYNDVAVGPEQFVWLGNDSVIYSKNVIDNDGSWAYSKDVHSGIHAILSTNLTTHRTTTLVSSSPGGASRPELSRDGRSLAFVRRVRDKEVLVIKDLHTGTIHHIWDGLTYDSAATITPMGTYPSFAFSPGDNAVIIWAAGKLHYVPLTSNTEGEKVSAGRPITIPFIAHIEKRIAETRNVETDVLQLGLQDKQRIFAFTELRANEDGSKVVFQASGSTYVYSTTESSLDQLHKVPVLHQDAPYFSPSFVPGAQDLIIHARWSDRNFTTFELANMTSGQSYELTGLPLGRYYSPIFGEVSGETRKFAFIKTAGDKRTGNIVATAGAGLYVAEAVMPSIAHPSTVVVQNIQFISENPGLSPPAHTKLRFVEKDAKISVQQPQRVDLIDIASGPDPFGDYFTKNLANGRVSSELVASLTSGSVDAAAVDYHHVYIAANISPSDPIWAKPGNSTKDLVRLSVNGGHDVAWSGDGKKLFWLSGPSLYSLNNSDLESCAAAIASDPINFGISCSKDLPEVHDIVIEHPTEIYRLKQEILMQNASFLAFTNASALTMHTGSLADDSLQNVTILVQNGRIDAVIASGDAVLPPGTVVIDADGGVITPGFIDVHAHWDEHNQFYPAQAWDMLTFLAYGVTTVHNPSGNNVLGYWERSRVEGGQIVGPRIFQTGDVVFGGAWPGLHEEINTMDEAYAALRRIKAEGGPASFSYKNYDLPSRASRQRLLSAARNLNMLCFPEGGMNFDWDQTYIVDGMTTVEHAIPIPVLYDDIKTLFVSSGTSYTPTHVVNYGGVWGEQYVWATKDIPNDPKLRRFIRHDMLDRLAESTSRPKDSYAFYNTSASTADMVRKGLRAHIGAHGEQPIGLLYHSEMFFARQGGLTNYEVLRAATADAAKTLGIFSALGSITPGKFADLLVFNAGSDLVEGDIKNTRNIRYVVRGGRVWDAETMVEVWPNKGRKVELPPLNPE